MIIQPLPVADLVAGEMVRARGFLDDCGPRGFAHYELSRGGRILVPRTRTHNAVNNMAKNQLLDAFFNSGARQSAYYVGLVDSSTFTAFQATDTIALHASWTEFLGYTHSGSSTSRGPWGYGSAAGQQVTNASAIVFDFTATGTVQGIMVTADPTKSGTGSLLWSTASFLAPLAVQSGDQLRVTYTVQL